MTPEQITALKNAQSPATVGHPAQEEAREIPAVVEEAPVVSEVGGLPAVQVFKRYELGKKNKAKLLDIARQKGVPADETMTCATIIDAVMASQEAEPVIV